MKLDLALLAVLVIVTVANISLVVAAARGRSLAEFVRPSRGAPRRNSSVAAAAVPAPGASFHVADGPRPVASDPLPPDLAELLARPAPLEPVVTSRDGGDGADGRETRDPREPRELRDVREPRDGRETGWDRAVAQAAASSRMWAELAPAGPRLTLDAATSLENAAGWSRIMEIENARLLRYRRPVTIVIAEIEGIRRLADRVGAEPVERLLPVVADAFRKEARGSDWIARVGEYRFAILMPETDEIQAINYIERVRLCCEPWLGSAAVPLRLAMGWASPPASGDLEFAVRRAEERMNADRRAVGKSMLPVRSFGPRVVSLPARPVEDSEDDGAEDVAMDLAGSDGGGLAGESSKATPADTPLNDAGPKARRHPRRERGEPTGGRG